ncbi:hypothetical protein M422DRAFT_255407 [Sphaerobolus stellatus SS14]|uniref:Uncharacterized protein n=1 Tax=Sphaerobolus stellatus (strain SS14) TaxID=990650 RepID=A0A0C9VSS1_SPHS4|nr:hypothetical protein M422DRAFT_255407 [Sphaerobolus stellatus SS14]
MSITSALVPPSTSALTPPTQASPGGTRNGQCLPSLILDYTTSIWISYCGLEKKYPGWGRVDVGMVSSWYDVDSFPNLPPPTLITAPLGSPVPLKLQKYSGWGRVDVGMTLPFLSGFSGR